MLVCVSCDAQNDAAKMFCEQCGSALSRDTVVDDALAFMLGLVCDGCASYNEPGTTICTQCGVALLPSEVPAPVTMPPGPDAAAARPAMPEPPVMPSPALANRPVAAPALAGKPLPSVVLSMPEPAAATSKGPRPTSTIAVAEKPCPGCQGAIKDTDRFCRHCGAGLAGVPPPVAASVVAPPAAGRTQVFAAVAVPSLPQAGQDKGAPKAVDAPSATQFFGAVTVERYARLLLLRGDSSFGNQWRLQAGEIAVGREEGVVLFPDDNTLARKHLVLTFRGDTLLATPLPTKNGVFLRIRGPESLVDNDELAFGDVRLRLRANAARVGPAADMQGTQRYGSPAPTTSSVVVERVYADGRVREVFRRDQRVVTMGRQGSDIVFSDDAFLSGRHCSLTSEGSGVVLRDLDSKNGTFVRLKGPKALQHGDILRVGGQMLRVEVMTGSL